MTDETQVTTDVEAVADTQETNVVDPKEYEELRAEVERLREHKQKYEADQKAKVEKAKLEKDKAERERLEAEGNYKELLALKEKEFQDKLKEFEDQLTSYEQEKRTQKINNAASDIARQLTKHAGKASDLTEKLAKRIKLTEEGLVVVDDKGKLVSDKLDSLSDYAKKTYDYLCDGLQSTGSAGLVAVKPTGVNNDENIDPVTRLNRARGIK